MPKYSTMNKERIEEKRYKALDSQNNSLENNCDHNLKAMTFSGSEVYPSVALSVLFKEQA